MIESLNNHQYSGPDGRSVKQMFGAIASRYDLLNHVLSAFVDQRWRRRTVSLIASFSPDPADRCLDLCTGTGDLAIEIAERLKLETYGSDFCHPMLVESLSKIRRLTHEHTVRVMEADTQELPFLDDTFRFTTVAFGVRNIESMDRALKEMYRVLRPGGTAVILEFSKPAIPGFNYLFGLYFTQILPRIGTLISGIQGPYEYLPKSVKRFPNQREFARIIESIGFEDVEYRNLTGGIAALHWGTKPLIL